MKRSAIGVLGGAAMVVGLVMGAGVPANAANNSIRWKAAVSGCTEADYTGENGATTTYLRGATLKNGDLCTPGTRTTGVDIRIGSSISYYTSVNNFVSGQKSGSVAAQSGGTRHWHSNTSRSIAAIA